jgi:hypothetical protein
MSSCQTTHAETNSSNAAQRQDSALYSALMAHYLHQDRLLWSRTQLLIAVQAAILAAGFSQRSHWLAPAIMLFGALLTFLILILVIKDQADRDANLPIMDKLADDLLPDRIKDKLHQEGKDPPIRLTTTLPPWVAFIRGRYVIKGVLIIFIFIDILLAALYTWASFLFP